MRTIVKAAALAVLVGGLGLAAASAAEKAPAAADPGQEIKEGVVKFGHGVRDGAVRAWDAVKSAVGGGNNTGKRQGGPPAKDASKETK
jgi:hypothetical protein